MENHNILGLSVELFTLKPGEEKTYNFDYPLLVNGTIRIDNESQLPPNVTLNINMLNYQDSLLQNYKLTNTRYGLYFDEKPLSYVQFINNNNVSLQVYFEYLLKPYLDMNNETVQFITQLQTVGSPNVTQLYQGTNQRYSGSLANATFLESIPSGTFVAVRSIGAYSTTNSTYATVTIQFNNFVEFNANIQPYGAINYNNTIAFQVDATTNLLPSSATISNAVVNYITIDYLFDYNIQVTFSGYTISNGSTSTTITFNGNANTYYFSNQTTPLSGASITLSQTNTAFTLSPTSGTTANGTLPFTVSQALTSTSNLSDTITAQAQQAGISHSTSASLPSFDYTISTNIENNTISSNSSLIADLIVVGDITINSGVTLTTNGYSIICTGNFTNNGTINTGYNGVNNDTSTSNGISFSNSYGGSGGGGGANNSENGAICLGSPYNVCGTGGNGGNTKVSGGGGGIYFNTEGNSGNAATAPSLTSSLISSWYSSGMNTYLEGAWGGDGGGSGATYWSPGGVGGNGLYIQANNVIAGTINSSGQGSFDGNGEGGGGGGGSILISYQNSYTPGTYTTSGGVPQTHTDTGGPGGNGGDGIVMVFNGYPIDVPLNAYLNANNSNNSPIGNQTVNFTASNGTLSASSATSNSSGVASVNIITSTSPNTLDISTTIANINKSIQKTI